MNRQADWYFDFISPYAYLQLTQFARLPSDLEVSLKPVLFAGLLHAAVHPTAVPVELREDGELFGEFVVGRFTQEAMP